ncbi:Hypothetical protein PENO1_091630 [Penicillium occitanis (nom. inval.)]|nr:Hypothetical protein PENO1_091630 [Penicillium occitanis (nom. inval.)]PCG92260.1 hypothetical protein PENOC_093350 [Penicillium occitanis (nom. inval.)]
MDDDDVLDLGCQVLPWISNQVILIGQHTRNKVYGTLGCELFVLSQQIASISGTAIALQKLLKVFEIVDKACSRSRNEANRFQALKRIRSYKDSTSQIRQTVIKETQESLVDFVLHSPEYHTLLRLIPDCLAADETEPLCTEEGYQDNEDIGYPGHLNETLYTQLQTYATCHCRTGHLEWTHLRLSTERQNGDEDISFELVFKANSSLRTHSQSFVQWKESKVIVPRRTGVQKRKKVGFAISTLEPLSPNRNRSRMAQRMRRLELGEFCKLIDDRRGDPVHFYIHSNVLKVIEPPDPNTCRGIFAFGGLSLGQWLENTPHVSNMGKSHLAYTIAKSVWQYYNSPWMIAPWNHESIQLLNEESGLKGDGKPHPYLKTKLVREIVKFKEFYYGSDLMHQYPNILALGILLIEIAIKQPLASKECPHPLSETMINDYYTWAWTTAHRSNLNEAVHPLYEEAVNNCLNPELFSGSSIRQPREEDEIRARKSALYEKIVLPLKRLSDAYRDDWDVQSLPTSNTAETISHQNISAKPMSASESPLQTDFTVAIFCALPLEVNAVSALFDEFCEDSALYQNAPGDSNTYTLGRMGRHHAVLVHLPGMGTIPASQAASSIRSTYPNIKLALVVGICGSVPFKNGPAAAEILLGDIVVSEGIFQHDFGRKVPGAFLWKTSVTDVHGRPNAAIRGFLSKVKTTMAQKRIRSKIENYLEAINQTLGNDTARYPGVEQDELFQSTYQHKHHDPLDCFGCTHSTNNTACDEVFELSCHQLKCNKDKLVQRKRLQTALTVGHTPSPTIHFGLIASGDTVMKSGQDRDLIAKQANVIAFEMEGGGVWDSLPCLVVKGRQELPV